MPRAASMSPAWNWSASVSSNVSEMTVRAFTTLCVDSLSLGATQALASSSGSRRRYFTTEVVVQTHNRGPCEQFGRASVFSARECFGAQAIVFGVRGLALLRPRLREIATALRFEMRGELAACAHAVEDRDRVVDAADRE